MNRSIAAFYFLTWTLGLLTVTLDVAQADTSQVSSINDEDAEKREELKSLFERTRRWYRDALELKSVIPKIDSWMTEIRKSHPEMGGEAMFVFSARLCFGSSTVESDNCNLRSLNDALSDRPFWLISISRRIFGEGGGVSLIFDALTGDRIEYRLSE